jgi:hypothetical protein
MSWSTILLLGRRLRLQIVVVPYQLEHQQMTQIQLSVNALNLQQEHAVKMGNAPMVFSKAVAVVVQHGFRTGLVHLFLAMRIA